MKEMFVNRSLVKMEGVENTKCKTVAIFLIVGLTLLLTSISPVNAADITISGNEVTVIDSDYTQAGNILIHDSGMLIVKNGATLTASGYEITVKGCGTLKIENGVLKANKLSLHDDAVLEMVQNSKLELSALLAKDRTNITIKNAEIPIESFDANCKNIELSSAKIIGSSSVSIDVQSFSIADSTVKGFPVSIASLSNTSIIHSIINDISISEPYKKGKSSASSINCPTLLISNSDVSVSNINCPSKLSILNSKVKLGGDKQSSVKSSDLILKNSELTTFFPQGISLYVTSSKILALNSVITATTKYSYSSTISITSNSASLSNSRIGSSGGDQDPDWHGNGGDATVSITSDFISISNSRINCEGGNAGGSSIGAGDGGDAVVYIASNILSMSDSSVECYSGRAGYRYGSLYRGRAGDVSISISSKDAKIIDTNINAPLDFSDGVVNLTNIDVPSITAKGSATVYKYHWITANVRDKVTTQALRIYCG